MKKLLLIPFLVAVMIFAPLPQITSVKANDIEVEQSDAGFLDQCEEPFCSDPDYLFDGAAWYCVSYSPPPWVITFVVAGPFNERPENCWAY